MPRPEARRIGLIVNPIAGVGGPLAARGSDLFASLEDACRRGARPLAQQRAERALASLKRAADDVTIFAAAGPMGADVATRSDYLPVIVAEAGEPTTARDTALAARAMMEFGVDLLLFAGGDGTARDIFAVVGDTVPMVGIPAGVKMHSAVFALGPEAAGETAAIAIRHACGIRPAEIMDVDEAALAAGQPSSRLFGYAHTPDLPRLLQSAKGARPSGGEAAISALGRVLARDMPPEHLVILGPGTTMQAVKRAFGFEGTLLGVDAVTNGKVVALDADAAKLEGLCSVHAGVRILIGVIGHQGFVFGRGNQQISPAAIRAAGRNNLHVVATREKLATLPSPELHLDTGDPVLNRALAGYHHVRTGPRDSMMMRLSAAS